MPPAARKTDKHSCPKPAHVDGPVTQPCADAVLIGHLPAARVTDELDCSVATDTIKEGSPTVYTEYQQQARIGDPTVHDGKIVTGCPTVLIGDFGMGKTVSADVGAPGKAFRDAARNGTPLVCKGPCEACGQM